MDNIPEQFKNDPSAPFNQDDDSKEAVRARHKDGDWTDSKFFDGREFLEGDTMDDYMDDLLN